MDSQNKPMSKWKLAALCALLSQYRPDGGGAVAEVFGDVWDNATNTMASAQIAQFYHLVNSIQAEISEGGPLVEKDIP